MLWQGDGASRLKTPAILIMPGFDHKDRRKLSLLLKKGSLSPVLDYLSSIPPKKVIGTLIRSFYHPEGLERWIAIRAFGYVVDRLAQKDMEEARIVMRRLMWSLNDESGGIGWGAPEAMAEAMAQNETLAREYSRILLSYVWEEGNFLEYLPLRRGALWGLYRLAKARTGIFREIEAWKILKNYLSDRDAESKALAILALGYSGVRELCDDIASNLSDRRIVKVFLEDELKEISIADLAAISLDRLSCKDQ